MTLPAPTRPTGRGCAPGFSYVGRSDSLDRSDGAAKRPDLSGPLRCFTIRSRTTRLETPDLKDRKGAGGRTRLSCLGCDDCAVPNPTNRCDGDGALQLAAAAASGRLVSTAALLCFIDTTLTARGGSLLSAPGAEKP
jgi:hypothetical protein